MNNGDGVFVRELNKGMGQAVAERTVLRRKDNGEFENWGDVAHRVALGNSLLNKSDQTAEYSLLRKHIAKASILLSGRHLQHGDETQPSRNIEVFSNCSTAAASFLLFYLLLNGSGVGRSYDDDLMLVNWDNAPSLRVVLDSTHADFDWSAHESVRDALHKYGADSKQVMWFQVQDSREGWATALEIWENAAFEKIHKDKTLILDFSKVRPKGSPIGGMQDRPASGPVALMNAFSKAASLKGSGLPEWKQSMYLDHYFAECVLVGGARRAARMSTKMWSDPGILDFIRIKRPIEFAGLSMDELIVRRKNFKDFSFLWSSNNSVMVDAEFWNLLDLKRNEEEYKGDKAKLARKVFKEITSCSYADGTGEPGIINVDKLVRKDEGLGDLTKTGYVGSKKYQIRDETEIFLSRLAKRVSKKKYNQIVNPCGEVTLSVLGGYCVIADVVPFHADTLEEAEEAFRVATRALIRTNTMDSLYHRETARTNRIGVGMTGVHEFAWKFFRVGFKDLVNPDFEFMRKYHDANKKPEGYDETDEPPDQYQYSVELPSRARAAVFWKTLSRFNAAVIDEAKKYSKELGVNVPHTMITIKPAGTTSKLFGLTEGWHLPSMMFYLRWVQFRTDDPLVKTYEAAGYPSRTLKTYDGTTIVGFPTAPVISTLGMGDRLITAPEATPEEQYQWLKLGEKFWIIGETGEDFGNQISYTLKYDPNVVDFKHFSEMLRKHQKDVRVCSVMPQDDDSSSYEYLPEEQISKVRYEELSRMIAQEVQEDIGLEHVDCASGACPISFNEGAKV